MNISKQHIRKFGNITNQFFMLMHINICLNENQTGLIKTFQHFMQICITINCPLVDDESGERPFSSVAIPNNMHDKPASNLRMKIIEFIRKICNSQEQKLLCLNKSMVILPERGIDCFQWQYREQVEVRLM
uniref:Uncharacterized protein n=1 Tax=Romanomermis culicivorax TaxID=13658 RepID=A0A915IEY4_ROMCU